MSESIKAQRNVQYINVGEHVITPLDRMRALHSPVLNAVAQRSIACTCGETNHALPLGNQKEK